MNKLQTHDVDLADRLTALIELTEYTRDEIIIDYTKGEWPYFKLIDPTTGNIQHWMVLDDSEADDFEACEIDEYLDDYSAYDTKCHSGYQDRADHRQALSERYGRGHWVAAADDQEHEITIDGKAWFAYKMGESNG